MHASPLLTGSGYTIGRTAAAPPPSALILTGSGAGLVSTSDEYTGSPAMIIRPRLPRSATGHA
jgi:hypothetical protein